MELSRSKSWLRGQSFDLRQGIVATLVVPSLNLKMTDTNGIEEFKTLEFRALEETDRHHHTFTDHI